MSRAEQLLQFIAQNPGDPFPRYGLALEYKNDGQLEAAAREFATLITTFPDYTSAYLHAGQNLASLGKKAEARATFEAGLVACARKGDSHARGEIASALEALEGDD
jgi:tetratricopeptide (TPR) repeat protein